MNEEQFVINTPILADWAVEKIKEERAIRDLFIEVAKKKIEDIKEQVIKQSMRCDEETYNLIYALSDYMQTAPAKETKTQRKLTLPSGDIIIKLSKKDYDYKEEKLLQYLKENAVDYVEDKPKVKWGEFKKDLEIVGDNVVRTSTGEIIDCINVIEIPASCDVK